MKNVEDMTEKEVLELAAKAGGVEVEWVTWVVSPKAINGCAFKIRGSEYEYWNPRRDDGDALRLALATGVDIDMYNECVILDRDILYFRYDFQGVDGLRLGIVLAAAELGRTM